MSISSNAVWTTLAVGVVEKGHASTMTRSHKDCICSHCSITGVSEQLVTLHVHGNTAKRLVPRPLHHGADWHSKIAAARHIARPRCMCGKASAVKADRLSIVLDDGYNALIDQHPPLNVVVFTDPSKDGAVTRTSAPVSPCFQRLYRTRGGSFAVQSREGDHLPSRLFVGLALSNPYHYASSVKREVAPQQLVDLAPSHGGKEDGGKEHE